MAGTILRAILFDFDGVIVDSESLHHRAYERVLARYGVDGIPFEVYADVFSNRGTGLAYCASRVPGIDPVALKREKEIAFLELLEREARLLPGVENALRDLAAELPLALATGSQRRAAAHVLERFDLLRFFRAVIAREDYPLDKPAGDAFESACRALGETPEGCLAVEDSNKGLRAAVAARIACAVVPNDYTRNGDFALAAARLGSLSELTVSRAREIHRAAHAA